MAIPDFQSVMLPFLKIAGDQKEHEIGETRDALLDYFSLSTEEINELLPSGRQKIFDNRIGWARTYLKKSGLIEYTKRGVFRITGKGLDVLKQNPSEINIDFLMQFPEFIEFREAKRDKEDSKLISEAQDINTPEESFEYGYQRLRHDLAQELLSRIKDLSPAFFEKLVVELLVKMGYGGSIKDAGKAIGKSGDGGIDGIIKEDKLGLDIIYIQAKRWDSNTVGRPEIQKFAGALQGYRAKKGVFITTSSFSDEALNYVSKIDNKIVLIDGDQLTQLMMDFDIGVSKVATYDLKKVDSDYFTEE
ncbi:MAG: restriction endonuclease [Deltaproteobacteria bacterium GWB2_55_19]|nr:MAG: restriction endonuclease [Deltaproteobacteria bacterium GWB2_55_19]HAO93796.1 restriction endonuclease [Deltaproteobacteria bacterium]